MWDIDIPDTPGPPTDDAEVLVVAVSAPIDGAWLHGGPPSLTTAVPTASQSPPVPIGTVTVFDPTTGEDFSHAVIVSRAPPAQRLTEVAWFVADVMLPTGYR